MKRAAISSVLDVPGLPATPFVNYTCGGKSVSLFVPLTFAYGQTGNQYDTYVALQAVRLYVDPGTTVTVTTFTPIGSTGTLFLTLSGYLI